MSASHFSGPIYSANGFVTSAVDNLTASATQTQAGGTPITAAISKFTTVATVGNAATLPLATPGTEYMVINAAANAVQVFPYLGDSINGIGANASIYLLPGDTVTFYCTSATQWIGPTIEYAPTWVNSTANTATASAPLTAANITGGTSVATVEATLFLSGTLLANANATLPTVAQLLAQLGGEPAGFSYKLRIVNSGAGAFSWTVLSASGWTLSGTMSIAQNTWRDFYVNFTSTSAATLTSIGTGTYS
ncbi:hypothetical protein UFOVP28_37 [uncultured Caudovirales phage]|uniref:Uncharacterized protein n=1 Tax=uncultured Caudovirales phage TaxID=2100421 RepID=A0A6J5KPB5_9CAUD|nr:hypothetical protein UFOVP28_37 [uncultured Caudovirales phage]